MKKLIKRLNYFRVARLNNKGWSLIGKILFDEGCARQHIKRANWIYNLIHHGKMFKGFNNDIF
jgi:hypothetical protein